MTEIQLFLPNVLLAYITYIIATASPGPATLAIMGVAMRQGRQAGIIFAFGVVVGSWCWALLAAGGLTQLLQSYSSLLVWIKTLGALYLFWLAYKAIKSAMNDSDKGMANESTANLSSSKLFIHGLALHLTNPKAAFAWLAIVSIGLQADSPGWVSWAIVSGCTILGILVFTLYALVFSNQKMINLYRNARKPIESVMAAIFGLAGVKLLTYSA